MKKPYQHRLTILIFSVLLVVISMQKTAAQGTEAQKKIDSLLHDLHKSGDFNGTALVVKGEHTVYERSFGYSNGIEKDLLKTSDKFGIGSIYKELPAIAIMLLQEKGLLSIEDTISAYLPNLPDWSKTITIKHLFQYTSGLPKVNWGKHALISDAVLLHDLTTLKTLQFKPNTGYLYSNNNPFLLAQIVQNVSGQSFADYIREKVLKPVGLTQSGFNTAFPYEKRNGMAMPFNDDFEEDSIPFEIQSPLFLFTSSAYDLYKLNHELHSFHIISENSLKTISQITSLDFENKQSPLGEVEIYDGKIIKHAHHGSSGNYECLVQKDVKHDLTIVLLTNRKKRNVHEISDEIGRMIL